MAIIQNDGRAQAQIHDSQRIVVLKDRPVPRVPTHSSARTVPQMIEVHSQENHVPIPVNTVRAEHQPKNVHHGIQGPSDHASEPKDIDQRLPRRLADWGAQLKSAS